MEGKYVAARGVVVVCLKNTLTRANNLYYQHVRPSFRVRGILDTRRLEVDCIPDFKGSVVIASQKFL